MFESNEDVPPFSNRTTPRQQMYSRTASNESVGDGLMSSYSFVDTENSIYFNGNGSNRMTKRDNQDPETSFNADFLEEDNEAFDENSKGLLSSLMSESSRRPFDLIQEDYSFSASSRDFSSRILGKNESRFDQETSEEQPSLSNRASYSASNSSRLGSSLTSTNGLNLVDQALESSTLAMQQLYVSEEENSIGNRVQSNDQKPHSNHLTSNVLSTSPVNSNVTTVRRPPGQSGNTYSMSEGLNQNKGSSIVNTVPINVTMTTSGAPSVLSSNVVSTPNANLMNNSLPNGGMTASNQMNQNMMVNDYRQAMPQPHSMVQPLPMQYMSVDGLSVQGNPLGQVMQQSNQNQQIQQVPGAVQSPGFFVPPVYVDQNGQAVYYRVAQPHFAPELVYIDGTPADPMQVSYIPYQSPAYWTGPTPQDPNAQIQGQSVFMHPGGNGQAVDPNIGMRRMIYPQMFPPNMIQGIPGTTQNPVVGNINGRSIHPNPSQIIGANPNIYGMPGAMTIPMNPASILQMQQRNLPDGVVNVDGYQQMVQNGMVNSVLPNQVMPGMRDDFGHMANQNHPGVSSIGDYRHDHGGNLNSNHMKNLNQGGRNIYDESTMHSRDSFNRGDRNSDRTRNIGMKTSNNGAKRNSSYGQGSSSSNATTVSTITNESNPNVTTRDPIVEDFRNTNGKSRQWNLRDLVGHVVAFCQDQHGSRFIQQKLEICPEQEKQLIFDEIIPSASILMTDVFGNYVLQKLFEFGGPEQCESLSELLIGQCVTLSMQMYGCRVVQKALEYVTNPRLLSLVKEFENSTVLLNCVHDANGNHVIQKCIEVVSKAARENTDTELQEQLNSHIMFIIDTFRDKVKDLSSHPYGCRVVQRILEHCSNNQKAIVLEELRQCCSELVQDCYGNYVIQFVMQHGWEADRAVLIKEVHANLLDFSQHKFASNVVEKCLQYASKRDRDEMIWKIINVTFDTNVPIDGKGTSTLETMVRDPYANYVVQKVIDVSDEKQRGAILRYVRENITQLRRYTYGKHIILRLEKITNEKF